MKKILCIIVSCIMLILSGCKNNIQDEFMLRNTDIPIYNINSQEIGSICCYQYSSLVNNNIFYTKLPKSPVKDISSLEYWLYNIDTKENNYLGIVDDWMYNESHEDIVVGNHMYISVSTGSYVERKDRKQIIYDINLEEYTMTPLLEIDGGIPYNSFTVAGDRLIVAELLETGQTDLVEYDLSAEYQGTPVVHKYDEKDIFTDNSIRHITADNNTIYMVRLSFDREKDDDYVLYMDTYDYDLNLLNTIDISNICNSDERDGAHSENERKQWIAKFYVNDKYILYQNFSSTVFIGSVENQKIKPLMNIDSSFGIASEKMPCPEKDLLFKYYGNEKSGRNTFYLVNSETGEISKSDFYADDKRYTFGSASINSENMILLTMSYIRVKSDDEQLPDCLYYLNLDDLLFTSL